MNSDPADAPIRVLVADDHPVYRDGLVRLWDDHPRIRVVSSVGDGRSALSRLRQSPPDIAILDLQLPDLGGLELVETITREGIETRSVILTGYVDSASVFRAIAGGARGYLEKAASSDTITDAILQIAGGGIVISPGAQLGLAGELRTQQAEPRPVLTSRELDILNLAADGGSAQSIATELHISVATVKTHLQHAYDKLGVSDRAAAVAAAIRRGLLT
ncbi:response regulator [Pseudonocardia spinosispora]|uniref:response regulator n=1 Tax=Pseudonocardia spinosispora TaxID=103441 RepID=UPI0003F6D33F|nr:response regulator transcription factor [Pseudonocardia spinosispora]